MICPDIQVIEEVLVNRTELLREIWKIYFEHAYVNWDSGKLSQEEAPRLLGVCERTFRRHLNRYEQRGLEGLIHQRVEMISHRRAPVDEVMAVTDQYRKHPIGKCANAF